MKGLKPGANLAIRDGVKNDYITQVCVCVCERERESARERDREREKDKEKELSSSRAAWDVIRPCN
jgi:hypothetical protein